MKLRIPHSFLIPTLFLWIACSFHAHAAEISRTPQSDAKIEASIQRIQSELQKNLREKTFESASFGWIQDGSVVSEFHVGGASARSIFDLASLTKPLFSSSVVALLAQKKLLSFSDPVSQFLPSWQNCDRPGIACEWRKAIQVEHLLRHSSGLTDGSASNGDGVLAEKIRRSLNAGSDWKAVLKDIYPVRAPGSQTLYQDVNFITVLELARAALRASGSPQSLEEFFQQEILSPMLMKSSFPRKVPGDLLRDVVRTSVSQPAGQVHDPIALMIPDQMGHAGFFSSLSDLLRFASMLLQGGKWENRQVFSEASVAGFGSGGERGLGWDVSSDYATPVRGPFQEGFGHTGYTGTSIWVVPSQKLAWILLTNRTYYSDGADTRSRIKQLREFVATRIHEAQPKR